MTRDQRGAIIKWNELHAGRKRSVTVDSFDLRFDARRDVVGVQRPVHDHDRGDDVVFVVATGISEPRHIADQDLRDVPDLDRHAVRLRQYDVFDVADPVAFCQILGAAAVEKADTADIHRLLTEMDGAAAHIDVGIADRADHLGQGHVVGIELVQIDFDLELFGGAAPGVDLHDAFDGEQPALHHPILNRAKVGQTEMRRAL